MENNFTGFVLAGGRSSRMGTEKHALEFNGETFLERAVNTLKPICKTVKIVLNQHQIIETAQPIVRDIYAERGALGAIQPGREPDRHGFQGQDSARVGRADWPAAE